MELAATVYAFDSTTIDLCLALFPWARFRQHKGAIKLHTLLDLRGNIPEVVYISDGKLHDVKALDVLVLLPGAYYVLDRGYLDFARLFRFQQAGAFFVTRAKTNLQYTRRYSHPVDKTTGIRCDQTIILTGPKTATLYPLPLRRIRYTDPDTGKRLVFLTNDFTLPALFRYGSLCRFGMSPLNQFFDNGLGRHDQAERAPIGGGDEALSFVTPSSARTAQVVSAPTSPTVKDSQLRRRWPAGKRGIAPRIEQETDYCGRIECHPGTGRVGSVFP